ncbi:hypothetical protein KIN20_035684 [Parelaphostrongylus tenuis]|uniref:Uncharacterized protein n=1 Tax=Parelaphostrongylus tenuis TaxID=148309 RepID=A0AAD5RBI2_PARTN|nr:hypothetical protein KIN20_035684 [Parelaphostrongylus tenuis]
MDDSTEKTVSLCVVESYLLKVILLDMNHDSEQLDKITCDFRTLVDRDVDPTYKRISEDCYRNCSMKVRALSSTNHHSHRNIDPARPH